MDPSRTPDDERDEILSRLKRAADALDAEQQASHTTIRAMASSKRSVTRVNRNAKTVTHKATRFNSQRRQKQRP